MMHTILRTTGALAALGLASLSGTAMAASTNSNLTVQTTIPAACNFTSNTALAFANPANLSVTQTDASVNVTVNCTPGGAYTILANYGSNFVTTQRYMKSNRSGSTAVLSYGLSGASPGGADLGTTAIAGVGNGSNQLVPVYGRMPLQAAGEAGTYSDTVQLSISY